MGRVLHGSTCSHKRGRGNSNHREVNIKMEQRGRCEDSKLLAVKTEKEATSHEMQEKA